MRFDVALLIPVFKARETLVAAIKSALEGCRLNIEICLGVDDGFDYAGMLISEGIAGNAIKQAHTPRHACGPSMARNLAASLASVDILAVLDADDEMGAGRLQTLVPLAERHGVATGATVMLRQCDRSEVRRFDWPHDRLPLEIIISCRMPLLPVFHRKFLAMPWPPVRFCEDVLFNAYLAQEAGGIAFASNAPYFYMQHEASITHTHDGLEVSERGYQEIVAYLRDDSFLNKENRRKILSEIFYDMEINQIARGLLERKIITHRFKAYAHAQGQGADLKARAQQKAVEALP